MEHADLPMLLYPEIYVSSVVYECPSFNFCFVCKSSVFLRQYFQNAANEEGSGAVKKIENTIYISIQAVVKRFDQRAVPGNQSSQVKLSIMYRIDYASCL